MTAAAEVNARPTPATLMTIAATAFLARVLLFAFVAWRSGATLLDYAQSGDSGQYLLAAQSWLRGPQVLDVFPAARRFFPGAPMLTAALLAVGIPPAWAGTLPSWLAAAATAALAAGWSGDARVGWATAFLPPIYLYASSLVSSDTLALFFSLLGVFLASRQRNVLAGTCLGVAMLCRPFALFAVLGVVAGKLVERRWRDGLLFGGAVAVVGAAGLLAVQWRYGDALLSVRTYDQLHGGIVAWPLRYLAGVPLQGSVPAWKVGYVWAHALFAFIAAAMALLSLRRAGGAAERARAATVAVWVVGLVAFDLCIASPWAFHEFPRLLVPALPALLVAVARWLPSSPRAWLAIAAVSFALALGPALRTVRPEIGAATSIPQATR